MSPHTPDSSRFSRRQFIDTVAMVGASFWLSSTLRGVESATDKPISPDPAKKLGVALLGLGSYASTELAPALQQTRYCYLAGAVTGTPSKAAQWRGRYKLPEQSVYSYDNFDRIAENPTIDVVYVVTPNSLHPEFVIRAAKAGKHVICEKPMATSVADCQRMIDACRAANRTLSIGYRLHFDPYHLEIARLGREKVFGAVKNVQAEFGFVSRPGVWRLNKQLAGGGPLMDLGIYCVQAACYATGEDPVTVTAKFGPKTDPSRFAEVEESIDWTLEFPSGARSHGSCSYNAMMNHLRVEAASGWSELHSAFSYRGISGRTSTQKLSYPAVNQQALQMDGIAQSILAGQPSIVPGEMGLRDVRILMAIYEAARTGQAVSI